MRRPAHSVFRDVDVTCLPQTSLAMIPVTAVASQTYQGALDMLESVYIKTGGASKCFGSDSGGHGSGVTIELTQGDYKLVEWDPGTHICCTFAEPLDCCCCC